MTLNNREDQTPATWRLHLRHNKMEAGLRSWENLITLYPKRSLAKANKRTVCKDSLADKGGLECSKFFFFFYIKA